MKITACDRCRRTAQPPNMEVFNEVQFVVTKPGEETGHPIWDIDLCAFCQDELEKFFTKFMAKQ